MQRFQSSSPFYGDRWHRYQFFAFFVPAPPVSFERYSLRCLFDLLNSGMLDLAKSNSLVVKTASKNRLSIWLSDFAVLVWSKFIPEVNNELQKRLDFVRSLLAPFLHQSFYALLPCLQAFPPNSRNYVYRLIKYHWYITFINDVSKISLIKVIKLTRSHSTQETWFISSARFFSSISEMTLFNFSSPFSGVPFGD